METDLTLHQILGCFYNASASRTEASIANLQTDRNTLLADPRTIPVGNDKEKHTNDVDLFDKDFDIQKRTPEISDLLDNSAELRQTMNDLGMYRMTND